MSQLIFLNTRAMKQNFFSGIFIKNLQQLNLKITLFESTCAQHRITVADALKS